MQPTKISHIARVTVMSAALLLLTGVGAGRDGVMAAQHTGTGTPTNPVGTNMPTGLPSLDTPAAIDPDPAVRARMEHERVKALNDDRHKRMVADVDRLVALTNELKTDVDKTDKDELSIDVIKKAQEIEKLAHDVQSRMKN